MSLQSAIYEGTLRHRRFAPVPHAFSYRVALMWIDLAELDVVFRGRWLWSARRPAPVWLNRADYLGDAGVPLDRAVRDLVERETGRRPLGPLRMLTQLRTFGHCFNPVSFYYCYDAGGARVTDIVAEITNTPWNERHAYVLPAQAAGAGRVMRWRFPKRFHVSPFMPMDVDYDWRFTPPGPRLAVHMQDRRDGIPVFDATLALRRREITAGALALALARSAPGPLRVLAAIYWQALRLWLKRAPFHSHPSKADPARLP